MVFFTYSFTFLPGGGRGIRHNRALLMESHVFRAGRIVRYKDGREMECPECFSTNLNTSPYVQITTSIPTEIPDRALGVCCVDCLLEWIIDAKAISTDGMGILKESKL